MDRDLTSTLITRRAILRGATALTGAIAATRFFPGASAFAWQTAAAPADPAAAIRVQMGGIPIRTSKLADNLSLLSGPGGNVVVLNGGDGKFLVDTFVSPAWPKLKETLDGLGSAPLKYVIDTHWHFDHTDNNAPLHAAGATVLAHENTKKRMSQPHELQPLGIKFPPSPAEALPQQTFRDKHKLHANGETMTLTYMRPAHTDTDIYVHFQKANVLHTGDLFFNGLYPYIDGGTGGSTAGMIAAANLLLEKADNNTKIVPGHGPLGTKSDLVMFRDMLSTALDRVQKLKSAGKSVQEAIAAKPFADLDPAWGKGLFNGDTFVHIVYLTS
ncbi:MAG TPA: MBL fold metallo-hydrolase [Terriglobales bacterium]|nr:MBL fold metallo-hydrolase [Terriglobales bacterium]